MPTPVPAEAWDLLGRFLFDLDKALAQEGVRERRVRIVYEGCDYGDTITLVDVGISIDKWVRDSLYTDGIAELRSHVDGEYEDRDVVSIRAANWVILARGSRDGDRLEVGIHVFAPKYIFNTILSEVQKVLRERGVEPEVEA